MNLKLRRYTVELDDATRAKGGEPAYIADPRGRRVAEHGEEWLRKIRPGTCAPGTGEGLCLQDGVARHESQYTLGGSHSQT